MPIFVDCTRSGSDSTAGRLITTGLRLLAPLTLTKDDVDIFIKALEEVL